VGSILGRMVATMVIWLFLIITPHSSQTEEPRRPPTPTAPQPTHANVGSDTPAVPTRPTAGAPAPPRAYAAADASFGLHAPPGAALPDTGGGASIPPAPSPLGGPGLRGALRGSGRAADPSRNRQCYPAAAPTVPSLPPVAPPPKLSAGASQPRPSAEQQTRTYLRWKAAIALGKALTCGLIYALTGLPLWPVFALLVFWLHWVPIVGSAIAIVMPLPLVRCILFFPSAFLFFSPFSFLRAVLGQKTPSLLRRPRSVRAAGLHPASCRPPRLNLSPTPHTLSTCTHLTPHPLSVHR
jgi:hypothetical protein